VKEETENWKLALALHGLFLLSTAALAGTADLGLALMAVPEPVRVGNTLTYTLNLTNRGPDRASVATLTDILPAEMEFISCTVSQGGYSRDGNTLIGDLGALDAQAGASLTIVARATAVGVFTNQASATTADDDPATGDNRAAAVTTVRDANRPPQINLPGPLILPVGAGTNFAVTATDPDHDPGTTLTNMLKPVGATFADGIFAWTPNATQANTTNWVVFVANDGLGETNSVVTNSLTITVPYDADGDQMADAWEWNNFGTLTNGPAGDPDGDGMSTFNELIAGTQATNRNSCFAAQPPLAVADGWQIRVPTEPQRRYTIYFADGPISNGAPWKPFANSSLGVWTENSATSTWHVFTDDGSAGATGGTPAGGQRFFKIKAERL